MKRRTFLKSMALASGAALVNPTSLLASEKLKTDLTNLSPKTPGYWNTVRSNFLLPADYAYFNTGSIGSQPTAVLDATAKVMREQQVLCPSSYDVKKWDHVTELSAKRFNSENDEIAFTSCTTEGNNIILNGIDFKEGDEVISTTYEHCGLIVPLLNMKNRKGIVIKTFEPDIKDGLNNVKLIEKLITPKTKLIFISHVTCTNGQNMPAKEIGKLAKAHNILFALDGAQVFGNMEIDVKDYDCDFYATSGHKWMLAPRRTGILYVKKDKQDLLQSTTVGAYSDGGWNWEKQTLKLAPSAMRYVYGTQSEALVYGIGTAIDFHNTIGEANIWDHNRGLAENLVEEFKKIPKVEIASPEQKEYRTPQITFRVKGVDYNKLCYSYLIGKKKLRCRGIYEGGVNGVRVSCHIYNNGNEIDKMVETIKNVASGKVII
jgi:selenocysteine lyase/cysteine desulfurase